MTFLTVLAWTSGIILVLLFVLFVAFAIWLAVLGVQERRISNLEAQEVEAEQQPRPQFAPHVPSQWRPSDDALSHPAPHKPAP